MYGCEGGSEMELERGGKKGERREGGERREERGERRERCEVPAEVLNDLKKVRGERENGAAVELRDRRE